MKTGTANRIHVMMSLIVAASVNGAVVLQYIHLVRAGSLVAARILPEFLTIAVLSFAGSIALLWIRKQRAAFLILVAKGLLALLLGIPLADQQAVRATMLCLVVFEMQLHLAGYGSVIVASALILLGAIGPREVFAWGERVRGLPLEATAQSVAIEVAVLAAGLMLNTLLSRAHELQEQATGLERTVSQLISANKEFQDYAQVAREAAEREERMRISRDIHDTVGYTLTNLIVMMESATDFSKIDPPKAEALLERARDIAVKGLEDTRTSLRLLRSTDPGRPGGLRMVQQIVKTFAGATAIGVSVEYGNLPWSLGEDVDAAICHVTQESLINAFRHGHASRIRIAFWLHDREVRISISDNGRGAAIIKEGIGFQGMQERIGKLGGGFVAGNDSDGFSVVATIPVPGLDGDAT